MSRLRIIKNLLRTSFLISILAIVWFSPLTLMANAKTTVADILVNPDKYDGRMVQVEGWVLSLQFNASRVGPYTTFQLGSQSGKVLSFVSLGILPIKKGDFVSVTARYNKSHRLIWVNSILNEKEYPAK